MKGRERIKDYLRHISEAINRAESYIRPIPDFAEFQANWQVQDAVIRNIEIVGEAASKIHKVDPSFVKEHAEVPWAKMRGIRNLVIHEYFAVDLKVVWTTMKEDLPKLKRQVEALLASLE